MSNNNSNSIDRFTGYIIDRYNYVKARMSRTAPRYIGAEVSPIDTSLQNIVIFDGEYEDIQQKLAVFVSWIFSNIVLLGQECSAQPISVKTRQGKSGKYSKTIDHPLAKIFRYPNEFMPLSFLIRHLIFGLSISKRGAFWYLAPDSSTGELTEIWPIDSDRIEPIKDTNHYVKKFLYTAKNPLTSKTRQFYIDKKFVFWVKYPDPWDYWASLPPLLAAFFPAKLDRTIEENQLRNYGDSRGIPLSVVSLDPNISETDFEIAKEQIIHDWQDSHASIAITRGGQISVQALGFTYEQLETIGTQEINRDKIDSIFFGYPYRSAALSTGEGLKQMDRIIKEKVVYPLLVLLQQSIDSQIIRRWFEDDNIIAEFDDPRTADRALNIQKSMIDSRWKTINDMREQDGEPPIEEVLGIDIGNMPVSLANNSSFLLAIAGLSGAKPQYERGATEVGNLSDSQAPEARVNEIVDSSSPVPNVVPDGLNNKSIMKTAMLTELGRWKTVARRNMERDDNREFVTDVIPVPIQTTLKALISQSKTKDELFMAFDTATQSIDQWIDDIVSINN